MDLFLDSLYVYSMSVPHCFDYYRFVVSFEMGKYEFFHFILLFKIVLAFLDPLPFHTKFRFSLSISGGKKTVARILTEIALTLWINLGSVAILTTLFSDP